MLLNKALSLELRVLPWPVGGDPLHPWSCVLRPPWGHRVVPERVAEEAELSELGMGREVCVCSLAAAKTVYLQVCFSRKRRPAEEKRPCENISMNLFCSSGGTRPLSKASGIRRGRDEAGQTLLLRLHLVPGLLGP